MCTVTKALSLHNMCTSSDRLLHLHTPNWDEMYGLTWDKFSVPRSISLRLDLNTSWVRCCVQQPGRATLGV